MLEKEIKIMLSEEEYEKAAELLSDDDDIEFEIYMLKIEIENQ